jgi:hypothetical protein
MEHFSLEISEQLRDLIDTSGGLLTIAVLFEMRG